MGLIFSFANLTNLLFVDPIPILFYFIVVFFIWSELVQVDPSWSGPTFVPASSKM